MKAELKADLELIKSDLKYIEEELKINSSYAERLSNATSDLDTLTQVVRQEYDLAFSGLNNLDNTTFKSLESTGTINLLGNDLAIKVQKYYLDRELTIKIIDKNLEIYYNLMELFMLEYPQDNFAIKGHLLEEYWERVDLKKLNGMFNGLLTCRLFNLIVRKSIVNESIDKTQNLINQIDQSTDISTQ